MIHTYKRKRRSLKSCSFYERLCGDSLTECLPIPRPIEKKISNDCCSRDAKEVKCNGWSKEEFSDNSSVLQSLHRESLEQRPIKFKYVRRCKSRRSSGTSMLYVQRMTKRNALQPDIYTTDCISFQSKLLVVDPNQDIPGQDTVPCSGDSLTGKQYDISDKSFGPLENRGSLCRDTYSVNWCINVTKECEARQVESVSSDIDICNDGSVYFKVSHMEENEMGHDSSNISAKRDSESNCSSTFIAEKPNSKDLGGSGTDDSSFQQLHKRIRTKCSAPLLTYHRRPRKGECTSRTYADLLAERANHVSCGQILTESAKSHTLDDVPEIVDRGISENVVGHKASLSPPLEKLTDGLYAIGSVISGQENRKERNGSQLMDDVKTSEGATLNNKVETGQQSDDAIKPPCPIHDLSNKESLTSATMNNTFKAALGNSQNRERATVGSQHFSDKVDLNLAAKTACEGVDLILQSKALLNSVERNTDASLSAEAQGGDTNELLETMNGGGTRTNGLPNLNAPPPNDTGFISQKSEVLYSVALPNGSTNGKVLQLFPEGSTGPASTGPAVGISNSGSACAVSFNNSSSIMAQPDSSTGPGEFTQNKMFEPSSCQERSKLLLDGIHIPDRPQIIYTEAFRQNFRAFASHWSEEELDNLWVGVRRHGKYNWYAMLRDPKLQFSPWRTERDLAEKWIMEQTKLLDYSSGPQCQYAKPVGIPMPTPFAPPRPGSMTRFLTDPTQVSLSTSYLNSRGITLPPMPPLAVNNALGNGSRLLNRRVRANRRSRQSQNSWGRFKTRNDVMPPPQFPSSLATTFRNDFLPPLVSSTFDHPKPLPAPLLSLQHSGNSTQFHDRLNNNGVGTSTRNGTHLANCGLIIPNTAVQSAPPCQTNLRNPMIPKVLINLDSDASSEGTVSDDGK